MKMCVKMAWLLTTIPSLGHDRLVPYAWVHWQSSTACSMHTGLYLQDSATAKALAFHKEVRTRCVTLDGDDFNPGGLLTGEFPVTHVSTEHHTAAAAQTGHRVLYLTHQLLCVLPPDLALYEGQSAFYTDYYFSCFAVKCILINAIRAQVVHATRATQS